LDGAITYLGVSLLVGEFFLPPFSWRVIALPSHAGQDPKHAIELHRSQSSVGPDFFFFFLQ